MKQQYIYIKQDSDLNKALEIARREGFAWLDPNRVIVTSAYDRTVYKLAKAGIHFSKWN